MRKSLSLIYFSAFITCCCLLLSCGTPKAIEYRDFKNLQVGKLGFASSQVKMDLIYYNPNNFGLQLKRTDLDVYIDDVLLGHTTQEYQISILKKADFTIPLAIDVDMKNMLKNGLVMLAKKEVTMKLKGTVKMGKANVFISFPVNYEGKQSFTVFQ
jgi:LEA14-like dessication related protein